MNDVDGRVHEGDETHEAEPQLHRESSLCQRSLAPALAAVGHRLSAIGSCRKPKADSGKPSLRSIEELTIQCRDFADEPLDVEVLRARARGRVSPARFRRTGSARNPSTPSASCPASSPVTPASASPITSRTPPTSVLTPGTPDAIASINATGVPFVSRRQQEHIGGPVDGREVPTPAEKPHLPAMPSDAACASSSARSSPSPAIKATAFGCRSITRLNTSRNSVCRLIAVRRPTVVITGTSFGQIQRAARFVARAVVDGGERRQVEAEPDDAVLRFAADAIHLEQLATNRRRDGDDRVAQRAPARARTQ